jgi:uncharacterized membrane protein
MAKTQQAANRRTTARPGAPVRKGGGSRPAQPRAGAAGAAGAPAPDPAGRAAAPAVPPAPGWLRLTALALALAGLGFSVYLTITHLFPASLFCASKGFVDCAAVTTSGQSEVFGIFPVAELGLAFYVFMVAINLPWAWRADRRELRLAGAVKVSVPVRWLRLGSAVAGMGFVLYLLYAELIQIGNICLYCTGVHIVTFLLFTLIVFDSVFRQAPAYTATPAGAKRTKG